MMNNVARPFARWAALALALALAAVALGSGAVAQAPAYPSAGGLDHFRADDETIFVGDTVTVAVGYRHQICLVSDADVRPRGTASSSAGAIGPTWVIRVAEGSPTVEGVALVHPDEATGSSVGRESCVFWTSSAPGTQTVLLRDGARVLADDARYTAVGGGTIASPTPLRVRWVDEPAISVTRLGRAVTAPIEQRLNFFGTDARGDHYHTNAAVRLTVNVTTGGVDRTSIAGVPVAFAVTGACGTARVAGAVGVGVEQGIIEGGERGTVQWGGGPATVAISNPYCETSRASTTLAIRAGDAIASVRVNWAWGGYADVSVTDVGGEGTTKLVTFHTAEAVYRGTRMTGYTCNAQLQSRSVVFEVSGGAVFVSGGLRQTHTTLPPVSGARILEDEDGPPARAPGAFGVNDSECRQSWTVRSSARSSDVMLTVTSAGLTVRRTLDFTQRETLTGTLGQLTRDIVIGGRTIVEWTFDATPVEEAVGDLRVIALYWWDLRGQRWLAWFPDADDLGVNTLTRLTMDGIYTVVTAR